MDWWLLQYFKASKPVLVKTELTLQWGYPRNKRCIAHRRVAATWRHIFLNTTRILRFAFLIILSLFIEPDIKKAKGPHFKARISLFSWFAANPRSMSSLQTDICMSLLNTWVLQYDGILWQVCWDVLQLLNHLSFHKQNPTTTQSNVMNLHHSSISSSSTSILKKIAGDSCGAWSLVLVFEARASAFSSSVLSFNRAICFLPQNQTIKHSAKHYSSR